MSQATAFSHINHCFIMVSIGEIFLRSFKRCQTEETKTVFKQLIYSGFTCHLFYIVGNIVEKKRETTFLVLRFFLICLRFGLDMKLRTCVTNLSEYPVSQGRGVTIFKAQSKPLQQHFLKKCFNRVVTTPSLSRFGGNSAKKAEFLRAASVSPT